MDPINTGNTADTPLQSLRDEGGALLRQGKFAEAVDVLTTAVESDSSDETAWRLLGGALASSGDYGRAVSAFERAIKLVPSSARNYYNLALAQQGMGRAIEARTAVEQSIALEPNYEPARRLLASLGGNVPSAAPSLPVTPPTAPNLPPGMGMGGSNPMGGAPPVAPPSMAPTGMAGLGSIGGGMPTLSAVGGGSPVGSSGMAGLGAIGGGPAQSATPPSSMQGSSSSSGGLASVGGPTLREAPPTAQPGAYVPPSGNAYAPQQGAYAPPSSGAYAPPPVLGMGNSLYGANQSNTSGTDGPLPPEATGGWNWGAFFLSVFWLYYHGYRQLAWGLFGLNFVINVITRSTHAPVIGWIHSVAYLGIQIYLGIKGNELGWKGRRFDSAEDFRACESIWAKWVLGIFLGSIVLGFGLGMLLVTTLATSRGGLH